MALFHVYIATSLDGMIADAEGGVGWLDAHQPSGFDFGAFLGSVDTILMGRATYDAVLGFGDWPYGDKPTIVMTSRPLTNPPACVEVRNAPLADVIAEIEGADYQRIWVEGGGHLIRDLLALNRVDRLELAVIPVILGDGVPLFPTPGHAAAFTLSACEPAGADVARLVYDRV